MFYSNDRGVPSNVHNMSMKSGPASGSMLNKWTNQDPSYSNSGILQHEQQPVNNAHGMIMNDARPAAEWNGMQQPSFSNFDNYDRTNFNNANAHGRKNLWTDASNDFHNNDVVPISAQRPHNGNHIDRHSQGFNPANIAQIWSSQPPNSSVNQQNAPNFMPRNGVFNPPNVPPPQVQLNSAPRHLPPHQKPFAPPPVQQHHYNHGYSQLPPPTMRMPSNNINNFAPQMGPPPSQMGPPPPHFPVFGGHDGGGMGMMPAPPNVMRNVTNFPPNYHNQLPPNQTQMTMGNLAAALPSSMNYNHFQQQQPIPTDYAPSEPSYDASLYWHSPDEKNKKHQHEMGTQIWGDPSQQNERPIKLWKNYDHQKEHREPDHDITLNGQFDESANNGVFSVRKWSTETISADNRIPERKESAAQVQMNNPIDFGFFGGQPDQSEEFGTIKRLNSITEMQQYGEGTNW